MERTNFHAGAIAPPEVLLRPLRAEDLDAVESLDRVDNHRTRRGYFEKRLAAALRRPKGHFQLALSSGGRLLGFLLARIAGGEYGRPEEAVVLEAIGVDPEVRHAGLGRRMLAELDALASARGIHQLVTQVDWRNHSMLRFLASAGFDLAPRLVLERAVDRMPLPGTDEEIEAWPPLVRNLRADDLAAVVRIDQQITGRDRSRYLEQKFDEALNESAIEVSLIAEAEGRPAAFATARVDYGDFGHIEPIAELDTIGVDPTFAHQGLGRAMLSQMIDNLAALHVKQLETETPRDAFQLLRFLHAFGFGPSQRLSFQRKI
jgi:ribosomal protein S18 acetylase RimI-like enzyme